MMKKVIAAALITAAVGSQAEATVFNGFAVGVNAGATQLRDAHGHGKKTLGTYGIQFDYEASKSNSLYWGLGLDVSLYSGKSKSHGWSYKYNFSSELDAHLGYNFCNQTVAYGLAGVKLVNSKISGYHASKKHTKFAPVIGAGVKTKVTDKVSAGLEYRYAFKNDHKITNHAVLTRISYHF